MMSGQNGSRQVIEAILAGLAQVSLPVPLAIVMAVADHASATAVKADNTFWPSELTNDFIALRFVEQVRQLDQVCHGFRSLPHRELSTD
jgi:hypothetical protein